MYIYVLDFSTARLAEIKIPNNLINKEPEDILNSFGFREKDCHYMITEDSLELEHLDNTTNN